MSVVVFADDPTEGRIISVALREFGLAVESENSLSRRMADWQRDPADIVILAWNRDEIPWEDVRVVRSQTQAPILVMNEHLPDTQECMLLEEGADLVLDRPVSLRLLANYVKVLMRISSSIPNTVLNKIEMADITLDTADRTVTVSKTKPVRLTQLEFRLLYLLMTNPNTVVTTDSIADRVWGYSDGGDRDLVRGLVSRLRRKIEPGENSPHFIENIPGMGYRFHTEPFLAEAESH